LEKPLNFENYLEYVTEKLNIKNFRFNKGKSKVIKRVAVCGGSGSDLVNEAVKQNADSYVTADIKYHTFGDAENNININ